MDKDLNLAEKIALVLINSDRRASGLSETDSRENIPGSGGYVRNALDLIEAFPTLTTDHTRKAAMEEARWRNEALAWVGRKVRIFEGPSTERGDYEIGTVICVDATDIRPSAWVKIGNRSGGPRSFPGYRSCDLCWLVDVETNEDGPVWARPLQEEDHGKLDADIIPERITAIRALGEQP